MQKPVRAKKRSMLAPVCTLLLLSAAVFAANRAGGENIVRTWLTRLADSPVFSTVTIALESGIYPPASVADTVVTPAAVTAALPDDSIPQAGQSGYIPDAADAAHSQPILETTAKPSGTVKINNGTSLTYDIENMLQNPVKIYAQDAQDAPQVMIVHTHSTEAYTQDAQNHYVCSEKSESERTLDMTQNVVRIGDEMAQVLQANGISTVHCREIFDHPAYSGSYDRSLQAILTQLEKTPSIKVVIDVHRDSIVNDDGSKYKTVCQIDGQKMAQLMLVVGTNAGGLTHDNWRQNLNYAVNLQSRIAGQYPALMRSVNLRKQRFNQHARVGSMLLEVGSSGNTLPEAIAAAKLFAQVLAQDLLDTE